MNLRAEEKTISFKITTNPGSVTPFAFSIFKQNTPICVKTIKWSYEVPSYVRDVSGYGWPKKPLLVTIENVCNDEAASPITFVTPVVLREISGVIKNNAHLQVDLCLQINGLLLSGDALREFSDEQLGAYAALDTVQRSMLTLQNSVNLITALPDSKNKALALTTNNNASDRLSLMIGDLFQIFSVENIPTDKVLKIANTLIEHGWTK